MIPSSPLAKLGAAAIALMAVGALVGTGFATEETRVEGGGEPVAASLGASFADLAAGAAEPVDTPEPLAPEPPAPVAQAEPPPNVASETPLVQPVPDTMPVTPMQSAPVATPPEQTTETVAADPDPAEPEPNVVERSPRPPERRERVAAETPRAGATQSARAGSETGSRDAPAARSGPRAQETSDAGNAAASNYPGEVMQRISRQRKPSVRARGTTTVAFQVAASGGLASAAIAGSSGSGALDREALRLIQRAAPFPPPPPGARRNFSIQISGR